MRSGSIILIASFLLIFGCMGLGQQGQKEIQSSQIQTKEFSYLAGSDKINAILCSPPGASDSASAIVITGGDGASAKTMLEVCQAFARAGMVALSHDNGNGSAGEGINSAIGAYDYLANQNPQRSISFWGHSSGTIFSTFAAFMRPNATALIETSGHMQFPVCFRQNILQKKAGCMAYWNDFKPKILIVHGEADNVVNISFAKSFSSSLDSIGKPHTTLYVSGAGHEFMHNYSQVIEQEVKFIHPQGQSQT